MTPLRTGLALAITVGVFYALCALVWALAPGPFLGFMNNLFHGMDFSSMVKPQAFAWAGFLTALLVLSGCQTASPESPARAPPTYGCQYPRAPR